MADEISATQSRRIQETQYKEHLQKLKQIQQEFEQNYKKEVNGNEKTMENLRKDYDVKLSGLKNDLEKKLNEVRQKHSDRMREETSRLDAELDNLRKAHEDRKLKMLSNNEESIQEMEEKHNTYLDSAKRKYQEQLSRYDS